MIEYFQIENFFLKKNIRGREKKYGRKYFSLKIKNIVFIVDDQVIIYY